MKRGAFFINIGRGMTTKLDDLVAALNAGEIAGAALDVYEQEPLPRGSSAVDHAERAADAAHGGHGPYLDDRRYQIMIDNCRAFL